MVLFLSCCCRDGGNTFTPERYRLELNSAHTFTFQGPTTHTPFFCFEKTKLHAWERGRESRSPSQSRRRECLSECGSERGGGVAPPPLTRAQAEQRQRAAGRVCMWSRVRARICSVGDLFLLLQTVHVLVVCMTCFSCYRNLETQPLHWRTRKQHSTSN